MTKRTIPIKKFARVKVPDYEVIVVFIFVLVMIAFANGLIYMFIPISSNVFLFGFWFVFNIGVGSLLRGMCEDFYKEIEFVVEKDPNVYEVVVEQ